jgi:hypothetical protein
MRRVGRRWTAWWGFCLTAAACGSGTGPPEPACVTNAGLADVAGTFAYAAFDGSGRPVLEGTLVLTPQPSLGVTGTWTIGWSAGADTTALVGPQVGSGDLVGVFAGGQITLDLNPGFADNDVGLSGCVTVEGFAGTWSYSGIAGPVAGGTFSATFVSPL